MYKAGNKRSIVKILKRSVLISITILLIMSIYATTVVQTLRNYQKSYLTEIYKYRSLSETLLFISDINDHFYYCLQIEEEPDIEHIKIDISKYTNTFNDYLNQVNSSLGKSTIEKNIITIGRTLNNMFLLLKDNQLAKVETEYYSSFYPKYLQLKKVALVEMEVIDKQQHFLKSIHDKIESKGLSIFLIVMFALCLLIINNRRILIRGVSQPLQKLNYAINRIINGDYSVRINENIKNELGDLCNTINTMSIEIQKSRSSLLKAKEETDIYHQQLEESHKMASIGVMSSGIAHELSQPLGVILLKSQLISMFLERGNYEKVKKEYKDIELQVLRAKEIIDSLRIISREAKEEEKSIINLNNVIKDVITLFKDEFRISGIKMVTDLFSALPHIYASQVQMCQIMANLLSNARDAVSQNDKPEIRLKTNIDKGKIIITVSDNGIGIPKKSIKRVFEPFYTLKKVGKGTGLGLSLCQSMIKENEGNISVVSEEGKGTTFYLTFNVKKELLHE